EGRRAHAAGNPWRQVHAPARAVLHRDTRSGHAAAVRDAHERAHLRRRSARFGRRVPVLRVQDIPRLQRPARTNDVPLLDPVSDAALRGVAARSLLHFLAGMKRLAAAALMVLATALAGCSAPSAFELTDITGADFGRDIRLTDHTGQARPLAEFKGKGVVVFCGYTHSPDVFPVTLAEMATVARELGKDA